MKGFFPNAPLDRIYEMHRRYILSDDIRNLCDYAVASSPHTSVDRGMPLGIEQSQQEMIALPSPIDNFVKCQLGVKMYGHYMDDFFLIEEDYDKIVWLMEVIIKKFEDYGMKVNLDKCHIIPLDKKFKFCKCTFYLDENGAVVTHGNRDGMKRARRKFRKFLSSYLAGEMSEFDVFQYRECQRAYYRNYNDHNRVLKLDRYFHRLFKGVLPGV